MTTGSQESKGRKTRGLIMPTLQTLCHVTPATSPWSRQVTQAAQNQGARKLDSTLLKWRTAMSYCKGAWTQGGHQRHYYNDLSFQVMPFGHLGVLGSFCYNFLEGRNQIFIFVFPFATVTDLAHCVISVGFFLMIRHVKR